eukprot:Nitzschia sp. Nitz4//scaffold35_size145790//123457//124807//NITZ4_003055-RA/size145790-processed-gene-0.248-mRNA-1//-1//CDS//3329549199//6243//frame0
MEKPHHVENVTSQRRSNELAPGNGEPSEEPPPKSFLYTMLHPRSQAWQAVAFKWFISTVILSDLAAFVVSTEPALTPDQLRVFYIWEGVTSTIFLVEYLLRLIVVTEATKYKEMGWFKGRLHYALTTPALIDFIATFPFFFELASGWDLPTLTYLRSFRLLRILKTSGFADATNAVYRVIYFNRQILYVALLICIALVLFTAVLMYYCRPQDPDHSQEFNSLGSTMYLATLMLTGQGGPDGEMPWYTKGVVLLTGVFSIGMFAIPASMLTWGFEAEAERMARMAYVQHKHGPQMAGANDNWSFSSADYSTDEEYRKIITGGDDSEDEEQEAVRQFQLADIDGSGSVSLSEFLRISREQSEIKASLGEIQGKELSSRLGKLEKKVAENSQKLDKIVALLENINNRN